MNEQLQLNMPLCGRCGGRGYTGCHRAHAPGGGCFIAVAFQHGVACACPAGYEFAEMQCIWIGGEF